MSPSKILFALSGSIACYKACAVISQLVQDGCEVQAVATPNALQFIGISTLEGLTGRPLLSQIFDRSQTIEHIQLTRWADMTVICPASGNTINKLAHGIADNIVGNLALAHDFTKPFIVAPAMNHRMLSHPATQSSLKILESWGVQILGTELGHHACHEEGWGRLLDPMEIVKALKSRL
jgi:phosphopantothenoylcysteine decarboxylase/phosphopantothenate--cysteine ligase